MHKLTYKSQKGTLVERSKSITSFLITESPFNSLFLCILVCYLVVVENPRFFDLYNNLNSGNPFIKRRSSVKDSISTVKVVESICQGWAKSIAKISLRQEMIFG